MDEQQNDVKAYLARIRNTVEKSESLIAQAELRIAETDRMLERQGLTREQVLAMRFSEAQIEAANAELKRRGLSPIEQWEMGSAETAAEAPAQAHDYASAPVSLDEELENRQRKFGMMMKPFQI
ncbi:MAG: hypothetical protein IJI54_11730 [Kiritimatiellae bacterium]|nr:hypothetical protein [Kiritimatiellia bacterium]